MKKMVGFFVKLSVVIAVLAAAAYWLSYFLAATGKKFCFMFGNSLPDDTEPAAENPASAPAQPAAPCSGADAVCAVDMCMPY